MSFPLTLMAMTPFEAMDRDQDGLLSSSEFRGPPQAFIRMDRDGDGHISPEEARGTRLMRQGRPEKSRPASTPSGELMYVDTHNHLVGPKKGGQYQLEIPAQIALTAMDAAGVKMNFLLPTPQTAGQDFKLRYEDLLPILEKYPGRFAALGGGGSLNVMIQEAILKGHVSNEMRTSFDARARMLATKGAVGFGEMAAEHFSMDKKHPYITAPPDHPLFLRLADLADQYDLPVDIHMEAVPEKMALPRRFKSPPNPRMLTPNIEAFERLLAHNRNAKIIWVHLGWDNTGKRTVGLTRKLFAENPNLYMSIRIASGMKKRRFSGPTFPLDPNGRLKPEWLELFKAFPDRLLMGSDEIIKPSNDHPSAGSISSTLSLLRQLPPELKRRIGYENAYALYHLTGVRYAPIR